MPVPYTVAELRAATLELVARNGLRSCYIRPLVNRGYGQMGLNPLDASTDVAIACWEWGVYLGEEGARRGVRAKVSSWRRISPDSLIPHAKASGQYLNNVLAKVESAKAGYEEAILLDDARARLRGHRREHLHRARRRDRHPRAAQLDPRRHHAALADPDRAGSRLHRRRAQHRARRAVSRRRGLHVGHGRRDRAGARGRRPPRRDRRTGRDHARAAGRLRRRRARALRALPRVAGRRAGAGARDAERRDGAPAELDGRAQTPAAHARAWAAATGGGPRAASPAAAQGSSTAAGR